MMHTVVIRERVCEPEDGLVLGNGDLSVSIYQTADLIIWRFGKNDVWDRRLDLSDCPKAAHIREIARGVRDEGWINSGYVDGRARATGTVSDPGRMNEICNGWPAYARRPFPCPKPVGELAMHLPIDQRGTKITQKLKIEQGVVDINLKWQSGAGLKLSCFVAPTPNAFVLTWEFTNWTEYTATSSLNQPWFTLYRWPDPTIEQFATKLMLQARYPHNYRACIASPKSTPLPAPSVTEICGRQAIEQTFHPDLEYTDGFRYAMIPFVTGLDISRAETFTTGGAGLHLFKKKQDTPRGVLGVIVPTSTDNGGVEGEAKRVIPGIGDDFETAARKWARANRRTAREFWSRSALEIEDKFMENVWYETIHQHRCAYRSDVIAPGLAMPSTVQDYSLWHGDYHMNYNYQQPFWGDYAANQVDMADAFFPGMKYMVEIGRKLARDYWDCRGTFIQVSGYPFPVEDDPYGSGSLCRMAYPTGWVANHYWRRYLYTQDLEWLKEEGYPVMRDCALFYADFLEKWDDGKYHAFPSLQGEAMFNGTTERFTDQPQVIRHVRYCLRIAIEAAELLGADADLVDEWRDRHDNLVMVDDLDALGMDKERKRRYFINPPEFLGMDVGYKFPQPGDRPPALRRNEWGKIGTACLPWQLIAYMRNDAFDPERDYEDLRDLYGRLRLPNGSMPAMPQQSHGYIGAYGESHGMKAPIQEMMLQSWDGMIRVFPLWPARLAARFRDFRAEGAFLVSAAWKDGRVEEVSIRSLAGKTCRIKLRWPGDVAITDGDGRPVGAAIDHGIAVFDTVKGREYHFRPV